MPNLSHIYLLEMPADVDLAVAAAEFAKDPHVAYAQSDYLAQALWVPNDPYYRSRGSWGQPVNRGDGDDLWGLKKIQAERAWDVTKGMGALAAVVDTGLDYAHPDLQANVWTHPREIDGNGLDDDGNGFIDDYYGWDFHNSDADPMDDAGHGTHVAGTIAAVGNNGTGIIGVAPQGRVMGIKVLSSGGGGLGSSIAAGIAYAADNGADVINLSLGWPAGIFDQVVADAIRHAYTLGVVVVVAAGNSNANAQTFEPANLPEVITVGASDHTDARAFFSNFGGKIDVIAPGGGGQEPPPDEKPYYNILSLRYSASEAPADHPWVVGGRYMRLAGTSMASPHVAGAVALILARRPALTIEQVRHALRMSADDVGPSGWDPEVGFGRLNVEQAVQRSAVPTATLEVSHESELFGTLTIAGQFTAGGLGLSISRWTLSYASAGDTNWHRLREESGLSGERFSLTWDVSGLALGSYWLRLEVVQSDGQVAVDMRQLHRRLYQDVSVDHLPYTDEATIVVKEADVDRDGDLDVFVGNVLGPLESMTSVRSYLLINDGSGHFRDETAGRLPIGQDLTWALSDAAFLDVEEDGDLDLVLAKLTTGAFLGVNNGAGVFTDQTTQLPVLPPSEQPLLAVGDVDGDRDADVIWMSRTGPAAVLINDGHGNFRDEQAERAPWAAGRQPALADLDRDGDFDLLMTDHGGQRTLAIGLNNGRGYFQRVQELSTGTPVQYLAVADVTGDGREDCVFIDGDLASGGVWLAVNDGQGRLGQPVQDAFPETAQGLSYPSFLDMDLDGDQDLLLLNDTFNPLQHAMLLNDGQGSFTDATSNFLGWPSVARSAVFADLTGDGYPDLLTGRQFTWQELRRARWDDFHMGDVNLDGRINATDAGIVGEALAGQRALTAAEQFRARVALMKPEVTRLDVRVIQDAAGGRVLTLPVLFGDVHQDGRVSAADVEAILQAGAGLTILTIDQRYRADVNRDRDVDSRDAALIEQYIAGLIPRLPWAPPPVLRLLDPDVDDDGVVSLLGDLFAVAAAFGKTSGDPDWARYEPYDLNGDGVIDLLIDIFGVASAFGTQCWPTPSPTPSCPAGSRLTWEEGRPLSLYVKAIDPEGEALTYSAAALPVGASFNPASRQFLWTPTYAQADSYTVSFMASDGSLSEAQKALPITVLNVPLSILTLTDSPDSFSPSLGQTTTIQASFN
ncbi:MAG: S8 family serine peptidase, partial [Candidatus Omnitrophota bacterium]|nr:S8 family serine peptidase [Candidatus Omnitrophota bacterium]